VLSDAARGASAWSRSASTRGPPRSCSIKRSGRGRAASDRPLWLSAPALPAGGRNRVGYAACARRAARRRGAHAPRVCWHIGRSHEVASSWSGAVDVVFIDGDHSEQGVSSTGLAGAGSSRSADTRSSTTLGRAAWRRGLAGRPRSSRATSATGTCRALRSPWKPTARSSCAGRVSRGLRSPVSRADEMRLDDDWWTPALALSSYIAASACLTSSRTARPCSGQSPPPTLAPIEIVKSPKRKGSTNAAGRAPRPREPVYRRRRSRG